MVRTDQAGPPAVDTTPRPSGWWRGVVLPWGRTLAAEGLMIGLGFLLYRLIAGLVTRDGEDTASAYGNARAVLAAEARLGVDVERTVNRWWADSPALVQAGNLYYVVLHFAVPFVVFGLVVLRRPDRYRLLRTAFVAMSLIGLAAAWLWPTAPPRLLPGAGYVDTLATAPVAGIGGGYGTTELENPYASMPSMHVGWAVWVAVAVALLTERTWVRLLAWAHPALTTVDIVVTGNHYVADAPAGALAAAAGLGLAAWWYRRRTPSPLPPRTLAEARARAGAGGASARPSRAPLGSVWASVGASVGSPASRGWPPSS